MSKHQSMRCTVCTTSYDRHAPHEIAGHTFRMRIGRPRAWRLAVSWEHQIGSVSYIFSLVPACNRPQRNGGELLVHRRTVTGATEQVHYFRIPSTPDFYALLDQTGTPLS
ncbi:hypothetical protein [Streptomyces sp. NRRL B-24572]|uniref:hypothetical protein n=1 Tax=Streptomyces sp. NRRL B-24572 TaxID=1962156 RepID=UPI00117FF571|nr:hypothetical protein [Streptomyces sp. NRRL B-24572]